MYNLYQLTFLILLSAPLIFAQAPPLQVEPVSELCLGCICEAVSNCNRSLTCSNDVCGIFRITWAYWADANKPVLGLDNPNDSGAYARCTNDPVCAAQTVTAYMNRFAQDCNNDGVINCWDYAALHRLGGYGCRGQLDQYFYTRFANCQQWVQAQVSQSGGQPSAPNDQYQLFI